MRWLAGIKELMDVSLNELWEMVMDRAALCAAIHGAYFSGKILLKLSGGKYDERKNFNRQTNSGVCRASKK